jgi:hypothetical protein
MSTTPEFQVQLVWNREFHFVNYSQPHETIELAIAAAKSIENSGDGARVKKTRVVDADEKIVWAYGKPVWVLEEYQKAIRELAVHSADRQPPQVDREQRRRSSSEEDPSGGR